TLNIGDREDGYGAPVQDVLMVGNRHRRSADGPARPQFRTTVVGDGNNPVSGVRLIGSHYENGAAADLTFVGPQPKAGSIGWLVTVAVKNGAGAPYSGALVQIYDRQNVPVFGGYTDASGRVTAPLVTMTYAQDGPDAQVIRTDDRRPFR